RKRFRAVTLNENAWLQGAPVAIRSKLREMRSLHYELKKLSFEWVLGVYYYYALRPDNEYSDLKRLQMLREQANEVIAQHNAAALMTIVNYMSNLLIDQSTDTDTEIQIPGTGIS
ncbi:MAG: hypothetical protein LBR10_01025, partial [Prevotellaceae bacterium]|nr:hypothetical protein [Prevotellaceae bacterium]